MLARQFLDDLNFRTACPHEPVKLSRYDWIIFPPPHLISWPPGAPARLVPMPPVRIDPRVGAWMPPRPFQRQPKVEALVHQQGAGRLPVYADPAFLDGLMVMVQALLDNGRKLKPVLRDLAKELAPAPGQRASVEVILRRAWDRHRAWARRERTEAQRSAQKPRRYRAR